MSPHEHELTESVQQSLLNNPDKAARFNEGKTQFSYLFEAPLAMEGLCSRFQLGTKKYNRNNWKKGLLEVELIDSLMRHLGKFYNGEFLDKTDGGYHIDAVVWNAVVLAEQYHKKRLKENQSAKEVGTYQERCF
jgi:hypothetical protein